MIKILSEEINNKSSEVDQLRFKSLKYQEELQKQESLVNMTLLKLGEI